MKTILILSLYFLITSTPALGEQAAKEDSKKFSRSKISKVNGRLSGKIKSSSRTKIDFNETLIEGKMKVPQGFFIQGRQGQSMANMVKLRSSFRNKLKQSKYGVKAIVE